MKISPISNYLDSGQIGIVIATYCEVSNIKRLILEIEEIQPNAQILIVDDSSPDGTAEVVKNLQKVFPNIMLLIRPSKLGLGTAITDGFKFFLSSKFVPKLIVTMDADYSHNPQDIPKLVLCIQNGDGLVIGSRYCKGGSTIGWPLSREIISRGANFIAISLLNLKINDCTSGFRCYSTDFLKEAIGALHSTTYEIQIETTKQANLHGFKIRELPVLFVNRKQGKSKLTFSEIYGYISYIYRTKKRGNK